MTKILCVAEKPSIAKAVANHLGGSVPARNVPSLRWLKNYVFNYNFGPWGPCEVTFTSVAGHVIEHDFGGRYSNWQTCQPSELFDAPIEVQIKGDKKSIAQNIEQQARYCNILYIWTDCDREGENIGAEIRNIALKVNSRMTVKRAMFNNIERAHIVQAANNPIEIDELQSDAVAARMELDLRVGAAFTRYLTLNLRPLIQAVDDSIKVISYGSCQFPTLGFVVDRYFRVQNFIPETFWAIKVMQVKDDVKVAFNWKRVHLFDRMTVTILYERCLAARTARITKVQKRPTSKWRPLPLTTVELQKNGSRFLRMDSQTVMKIAEDLYTKGWISYPRTETDQFDKGMDLMGLVRKQTQDANWGPFAQRLADGGFQWPRSGRNNDKAHPPIHPVNYVLPSSLSDTDRRVYEFVVRRFLACCAEDAKGELSTVEMQYGSEVFTASGLLVLERNYLDVYPYDKWESSQQLPVFQVDEYFVPTEAKMTEGKTAPPGYLTEPELIALMDANGIGTDATMAEHIAKIKERQYVVTRKRAGRAAAAGDGDNDDTTTTTATRGRGRGRGGRGGGGGGGSTRTSSGGGSGVDEFIPTTLGMALIVGYENLAFETSLSKPFLRKEVSRIQTKRPHTPLRSLQRFG
ncbi:prokaryotic type I DNA topoisomerase [Trichodelitschia bisporula]|uniref:DNA topoisomerase n=1 Tax=Trichodelitschia bisporula TaxID=703511 RepID=A0A6G1HVV6_9PEZI|nr:prokaryotic type I DNA topoisomerase [Trichodelitschia bisporula]